MAADPASTALIDYSLTKERNWTKEMPSPVADREQLIVDLTLMHNESDSRAADLIVKAVKYKWYSYYNVAAIGVMALATIPAWYWLSAFEYRVERMRRPLKVKNLTLFGFGTGAIVVSMALFSVSPYGFGKQCIAIKQHADQYDILAWEAHLFKWQLTRRTFDAAEYKKQKEKAYETWQAQQRLIRQDVREKFDDELTEEDIEGMTEEEKYERDRETLLKNMDGMSQRWYELDNRRVQLMQRY